MAIPTLYQGIEYRSRLEAKWASLFYQMGWQFEYEPFDGRGYIPDFVVYRKPERPMLVEVKPATTESEYRAAIPKMVRGVKGLWEHPLLILGVTPFPDLPPINGTPVLGLLGLPLYSGRDDPWFWDYATWGEQLAQGRTMIDLENVWATATNEAKWQGR